MNNKPNIPEEIGLGKLTLDSWSASAKAGGGWLMLVFLTDLPGIYLNESHKAWPLIVRAVIAAIPLMATLLYVRSTARWIRGMDELHRRITVEALLFATVAYLVLAAAWFLLNNAGVWAALAHTTGLHLERIPFSNCTFILCMIYILWGASYARLNRRYK
jgi:hypothetical protein